MDEKYIKYGYFSKKQKNSKRDRIVEKNTPISNIYQTDDGKYVEVTEICNDENSYNKKVFTDYVFQGKVVKWVKSVYY